jgi:hypothetical protein
VLPFVALALGAGGVAGGLTAHSTKLGVLAVLAAVLVLLVIWRPVALAVVAVVGAYAVQRVGGTSVNPGSSGGISYSDALLTVAAFLAVPAVAGRPEMRRLRLPMAGLAAYLACLLPTVVLNASHRAYLEWLHRVVLVGGSLVVGAWIVRERMVRPALRWLLAVSLFMATAAIVDAALHSWHPAQPFHLNKNFVGSLLAVTLVMVVVAAREFGITARVQVPAALLLAGSIVATHSRGGMLEAVAGVLIALMVDPRGHTRRARALSALIALVLAGITFYSVRHQLNQTQAERTNGSIGVRFNVEKETRRIWRTSPVDGVGLKYFNSGDFGRFAVAANNVVDNELAESGAIGLAGFVLLQTAAFAAGIARRRGDALVGAALGSVGGLLLHGMVDIYWTAGTVTLPFLLFGMALARAPGRDEPRHARGYDPKTIASARAKTLSHR